MNQAFKKQCDEIKKERNERSEINSQLQRESQANPKNVPTTPAPAYVASSKRDAKSVAPRAPTDSGYLEPQPQIQSSRPTYLEPKSGTNQSSSYLEPTNQPYAISKIAGIEMCDSYRAQYGCNFISVMPTNLYGTNDNYHLENSHVLPALIRRIVLAKKNSEPTVTIWGTGTPRREFLHVDDLADACYFLLQNYNEQGLVNIGSGTDVSIKELAELISSEVGFEGKLVFDATKPDGTPRKLLDTTKINNLGWKYSITLDYGIRITIKEVKFIL